MCFECLRSCSLEVWNSSFSLRRGPMSQLSRGWATASHREVRAARGQSGFDSCQVWKTTFV